MLLSSCGNSGSPSVTQKSPDGAFELHTQTNQDKTNPARYLCVIVDIRDATGKVVYREVTPASDTMRWSIKWIDGKTIQLDSSDIGKFTIRRLEDGSWKSSMG